MSLGQALGLARGCRVGGVWEWGPGFSASSILPCLGGLWTWRLLCLPSHPPCTCALRWFVTELRAHSPEWPQSWWALSCWEQGAGTPMIFKSSPGPVRLLGLGTFVALSCALLDWELYGQDLTALPGVFSFLGLLSLAWASGMECDTMAGFPSVFCEVLVLPTTAPCLAP